jgi:hypothetical protein
MRLTVVMGEGLLPGSNLHCVASTWPSGRLLQDASKFTKAGIASGE